METWPLKKKINKYNKLQKKSLSLGNLIKAYFTNLQWKHFLHDMVQYVWTEEETETFLSIKRCFQKTSA